MGQNTIFVGDKRKTISTLVKVIKLRIAWMNYMENVLSLVSVNGSENYRNRLHMNQNEYPFRIADYSFPSASTGYVYMLISVRHQSFTYIGQTKCLRRRLQEHNSGQGSLTTNNRRYVPYAVIAYVCGFDNNRHLQLYVEHQWQLKRRSLRSNGISCVKQFARSIIPVIDQICKRSNQARSLRLVCLFRE